MIAPIEKRIERYHAWRQREVVDRPLIGLSWEPDVYLLPELLDESAYGKQVTADQIHPEAVLPYLEGAYRQGCELETDLIQPFLAGFGIPWVEAIAGCPIIADPGSLWAASFLESFADRPPIHFDLDNPWLRKLLEFTRVLVQFADGRFPISLPLTRGPLDVLGSMRGANVMCLDFADYPDEAAALLDELTDLWIGINQAAVRLIPPFHGGYVSRLKMWAPGPAVTPQNDISSAVSPATYAQFALPCDRRIVDSFPYHSFHMHATEHHQMDNLVTLEKLTAIQTFLDIGQGGLKLETMFADVRRVLASKPVLLGAMDIPMAERCLQELPSAGLCLMLTTKSRGPIPEEHKAWLRQHCT